MKKRSKFVDDGQYLFYLDKGETIAGSPPPTPPKPFVMPDCRGLQDYGIHNEGSTVRVHVSAGNQTCYVFRTALAWAFIQKTSPPCVPADQEGASFTALGWLVKATKIPDIRIVSFPEYQGWNVFPVTGNTSQKGRFAEHVLTELVRLDRYPSSFCNFQETSSRTLQIQGIDTFDFGGQHIQVKCDYPAAKTGNLYLQRAERNPFRRV